MKTIKLNLYKFEELSEEAQEKGLMEAKVNRKNYFLTYVGNTKNQISVKIKENAKNDFGKKIILSNTSTFIYKT